MTTLIDPLSGEEWEGEFPIEFLEHAEQVLSPKTLNTFDRFTIIQYLSAHLESLRILHAR